MTHEEVYRVYYEDVDLAGIVYYANYLRFIERARSDMLRTRGINQSELRNHHGIVFVVRRISADYISPLKFDDLATVKTEITCLTPVRIEMNQILLVRQKRLFEAKITLACIDLNGNLIKMPDEVFKRLKPDPDQNG
ncbi:MAG: YbgC/FadM family acyl-CoA thioesterase [Rhodobacteraceae bacterium]|nr:YbgC/FadM family acyl-CoA thioesterase [Paracoccaceae bacterium]MXZ50804.1 YbgC/FadM family acyl-CoA thioesterase [Paracoccaceae bacterium]MYF45684.1 YbgC/FadM family acyl-CoA thioesterase [Paracoccaceae bacterium]MYI92001.1 YbgC/FadM family acyl-CoA thioesterase [Paracoccaceae bacterium]